ncbi:Mg2+/Co2+ transporter [Burkholderiales bacterium JOSHI_001]|nr:Mg2+/Co2+ transporter [Burkholderiales bacterium JOSHI_001]
MHASAPPGTHVQHFRQVLLWPLALAPDDHGGHARPWEKLGADSPWREVVDEVAGGTDCLAERHYSEFVTFLPYVQRFLYGEGRRQPGLDDAGDPGSPMRVFRRHDIVRALATTDPGLPPIALDVRHVDLYFFYDLDLVLLNVEVATDDITLAQAQDLMYRFGRGYPGGWRPDGQPLHSLHDLQWLDAQGQVCSRSDAADREGYLRFVAQHRAPRIAVHWAHLLAPLVSDHSPAAGALRFRQIEYYRMPTMAYLAVDDPCALTRADFVRLGLVTGTGGSDDTLPFADQHLADFEARHCYDRFFTAGGAAPHTRYLCCGHALVVVGPAGSEFFRCAERGVLAQFRHQHYLLFLIAHVQKAALLMFSDRLVDALKRLDVRDAESVKRFKRSIRAAFESFLRFTHRYWFHEISEQAQVKALFQSTAAHLDLERLYPEVKQRISDMSAYLDADSLRRQANTVVRLTVVTILGLIGTITTGFLGMNLLAAAEEPTPRRVLGFTLVFVATTALTVYTIVKSKRLSDFLDALSDERLSAWDKCRALAAVFVTPRGPGA